MIFDATNFHRQYSFKADLCVIGSGAGGSMAAMTAAERGLSVILLEAGDFVGPESMNQREQDMIPRLLWDNGGRANSTFDVRIHQGKGVGGSTLHNTNLCRRIPAQILREWQRDRGLEHLPLARWDSLYAFVEELLAVAPIPRESWNRHNQLLEDGCHALGWRGGGLSHNRTGCVGSGFCELGCAFDGKNNAAKVLIPRFVAAGGQVITRAHVTRIRTENGRAVGVEAAVVHPATAKPMYGLRVDADFVCVSGSATATAAILQRSGIDDPAGETGRNLHIHPGAVVAGDFAEPVEAWKGIPQSYECLQFLDFDRAHPPAGPEDSAPGKRAWIVPAFAHPMGTATTLPGLGDEHFGLLARYRHMAVLTCVLHEKTGGRVRPSGERGLKIDYKLGDDDRAEHAFGLARCVDLLFAAGAARVIVPARKPIVLMRSDDRSWLESPSLLDSLELTAVHPMSTVRMGDDPNSAAVDSQGKHHHTGNLWVADGSLFPTSIGGPPQLSIYALGRHVGESIGL